jgi:hypothetical protein
LRDKTASIQVGEVVVKGQLFVYLNYLSLTSCFPLDHKRLIHLVLGAGNYSITVTDGWGCSATSAVVVTEPDEVKVIWLYQNTNVFDFKSIDINRHRREHVPYSADNYIYGTF